MNSEYKILIDDQNNVIKAKDYEIDQLKNENNDLNNRLTSIQKEIETKKQKSDRHGWNGPTKNYKQ